MNNTRDKDIKNVGLKPNLLTFSSKKNLIELSKDFFKISNNSVPILSLF